jgi:hypothetical protein
MFVNRLRSALPSQPVAQPTPSPSAFLFCPVFCLPFVSPSHAQWQQSLYAWAMDQARAVVRPSLPARDLLAVWT